MKKIHEYEAKVLTALGFKPDDPVVFVALDLEAEEVRFKWYSNTDPEVPTAVYVPGVMIHAVASGEAIEYKVPAAAVALEVWDAILEARREWAGKVAECR
jgi:hypothetical protein